MINAANTKIRTTAGDGRVNAPHQKQLTEHVEKTLIIGDAIGIWITRAQNKKTVFFAVSVKHSKLELSLEN